MYEAKIHDHVLLIRGVGELTHAELSGIAGLAWRARADNQMVVIDLARVTHLHYAGATLLKAIPGLRAAGASRYVRDLVYAGGAGGFVELYGNIEEALRAA